MSWRCPDDWKYLPETKEVGPGMLMALMFGDFKRFQQIRSMRFRRCNASGKWIWPLEKAWCGVVGVEHSNGYYIDGSARQGSYRVVWLTNEQYVIQKLKGVL